MLRPTKPSPLISQTSNFGRAFGNGPLVLDSRPFLLDFSGFLPSDAVQEHHNDEFAALEKRFTLAESTVQNCKTLTMGSIPIVAFEKKRSAEYSSRALLCYASKAGVCKTLTLRSHSSRLLCFDIRSDLFTPAPAGSGVVTDAVALSQLTAIPAIVWSVLWLIISLLALGYLLRASIRPAA